MRAAIQLALVVLCVSLWGIAGSTAMFLGGWLLAISLGLGAGSLLSPFGILAGFGFGVWLAVTALRWHRFHWACLVLGTLGAVGWFGMGRWLRPELGGALICLILIFNSAAIALAGLTGGLACWVEVKH